MSSRKITLKQFCKLFVKGTTIMVVGSRTEKFCSYTDSLIDGPFADLFVDHCYVWNHVLWVVLE